MGCTASEEDQIKIPVPSQSYTNFRPETRQQIDSRIASFEDDTQSSIFQSILHYFDSVHEGPDKEKVFYDLLGNKMGQLYTDTLSRVQDKMIKGQLGTDDLKVTFSKVILLNCLNMINKLQNRPNWKTQRIKFFFNLARCQKKIIQFLKFKYPRNRKDFVPTELQEIFLSVDDSQHTDYDLLINSGINFDYQRVMAYERKEIIKQIKCFINAIIRQTNRSFQFFRVTMEGLFHDVEGNFKIGRKISQNVNFYSELQSESIEIYSPQIFRVIIKWISSMDGVFMNSQEVLKKKKYLKILEQQDQQFNYFPLYTGKSAIISSIAIALQPGSKKYSHQQQQQQENLANCNDNVAKILTKKTDIPEINQNQIKTIKYARYISKFVQFLAIQNLIYLISELVDLRQKMNKKNRKAVDLVACDVNDLLRCQFMGSKNSILQVFQRLKALEKGGKLKIIRIKNRFATPLNDTLINFKFIGDNQSFIVCEMQLILKKSDSVLNPKFQTYEKVNHVLYEIQRSIFGPMAEMSLLLTHNDTRMGFEKKIKLQKSTLNTMRCPEGEVLNCQYDLPIPYVCSLCSSFNHISQNAFPIHRCLNCNFYVCPVCLFEFDPQYSEECYYKQIFNVMKQNFMPDLEDHEDYGFFFFNKKYMKVSDIKRGNKNLFDCLEEKMGQIEEQYAFIIKFQEGQRYINIYTTQTGELLPCFYDFLPRFQRKNFKNQHFGPYDIVLFIDPNISVQNKPSRQTNLAPLFLTKQEIPMRKVKQICYFRWQNNFYVIDVGEQIRDNDSNSTIQAPSTNQDKAVELEKVLENYRERDGQLLLDYMDISKLVLTKNIENVRYAKLKSNRLTDISPLLAYTTLEQIDVSRNEIVSVKLKNTYPKLRVMDLSENYIQNLQNFVDACLPSAKQINVSSNMISKIPILQLSRLLWLNLANNQIQSLQNFSQSIFPKLRKLTLSENKIKSVPTIPMKELQQFQANYNEITDLMFLTELPKLERVDLQHNKVSHIPSLELEYLENILLENNQITDLSLFAESFLPKLITLDVSHNKIKQIPIFKFEYLESLDFSFNEIDSVGNLYKSKQMYNIKELNISNNRIVDMCILDMELLQKIQINNNKIQDLSCLVHSKIPSVKEINASNNSINHIPPIDLPELYKFNLEANELADMNVFRQSRIPKLFSLNLSQNKITKFISAEFPSLEQLFIDRNLLTDISQIEEEHLKVLKILNMCDNKIVELPSMYLQSVQTLDLHSNKIEVVLQFKDSVFPKLKELDLRFNKLNAFPQMNLDSLKTLSLDSNQISNMDGLVHSNLQNLQELRLPNNKIVSIKSLKLKKLSVLNLERNQLQSIEDLQNFDTPQISQIKLTKNSITKLCSLKSGSLTEIDFSHNKITDIKAFFEDSELPKLLVIKLNNNMIEGEFPIVKMPVLKTIDFAKNSIKSLSQFGKNSIAPKLDSIKGNNNKITFLQDLHFPKLKDLDLSNNLIKEIDLFSDSQIPKIQKINLQNNQIVILPKLIFNNLVSLNVDSNNISNLQEFERSELPSLDKLLMRSNKIKEWPAQIYLDKLSKLNLTDNLLTSFATINEDTTPDLKELILKKNKIQKLHEVRLPKMILLNLDANPVAEDEKQLREALQLNKSKIHKKLKLGMNKKTSGRDGNKEDLEVLKLKQKISSI